MNMKDRPERFIFMCTVVILLFACNAPANQPPDPSNYTNNAQAEQDATEVVVTPPTQVIPSASTPNLIQTKIPTRIPPTAVPLPDFEEVLNFAGGGAGGNDSEGWCDPSMTSHDTITTVWPLSGVRYGKYSAFCIPIVGANLAKPFYLQLTSPNGRVYTSPSLWANQGEWWANVMWNGYFGVGESGLGEFGFVDWAKDDLLFVSLPVWWPLTYPEGQWHAEAYGDGFSVTGDIWVTKEMDNDNQMCNPCLNAYDARSETEIMPVPVQKRVIRYDHPVRLNSNGKLDVIGNDFSANTVIYIVLYHKTSGTELRLVDKYYTVSDSTGSIGMEIDAPFEPGQTYWMVGLSDPNTPLKVVGEFDFANEALPSDNFRIQQINSANAPSPNIPSRPTPVNPIPVIDNVNLRYEGSQSGGVTAYWDISFHDADGDVNYINYKVIDVTPPTDVVVNGGSVDVSSDAQQNGSIMITGRWSCNGAVYNITFSAILYDAAGNQSDPYTYTMTCY